MQTLNEFSKSSQEILLDLEKTQKEFWNIDRNTANFLNMLIKIHNSKNKTFFRETALRLKAI